MWTGDLKGKQLGVFIVQIEEEHVVNLLVTNCHGVKRNSTPMTIAAGASHARVSD